MINRMKVEVQLEIDVDMLLSKLQEDAKITSIGRAGYEVSVHKQLLQDAHDVICELRTTIELLNKELEDHDRL